VCVALTAICISSAHEGIPLGGCDVDLMKSIAPQFAPHRIRVNPVCPGAVTRPSTLRTGGTPEAYRELVKPILYKRIGHAAVRLASDGSDYIRGAGIFVDGGMTRYPGFEMGG
jgi:glucose 1-dehydrogenase